MALGWGRVVRSISLSLTDMMVVMMSTIVIVISILCYLLVARWSVAIVTRWLVCVIRLELRSVLNRAWCASHVPAGAAEVESSTLTDTGCSDLPAAVRTVMADSPHQARTDPRFQVFGCTDLGSNCLPSCVQSCVRLENIDDGKGYTRWAIINGIKGLTTPQIVPSRLVSKCMSALLSQNTGSSRHGRGAAR